MQSSIFEEEKHTISGDVPLRVELPLEQPRAGEAEKKKITEPSQATQDAVAPVDLNFQKDEENKRDDPALEQTIY